MLLLSVAVVVVVVVVVVVMALQHFCLSVAFSAYSAVQYAVGRTPWTGDQPITRPLPIHRPTQGK
jgi:hypothetical protein